MIPGKWIRIYHATSRAFMNLLSCLNIFLNIVVDQYFKVYYNEQHHKRRNLHKFIVIPTEQVNIP